MRHLILMAIVLITQSLFAQSEQEKIKQFENQRAQERRRDIDLQLDSAIYLTDNGSYSAADEKYRWMLTQLKSLPSDFVYHFGRNSFYLGKFKQCTDWLNKYIQLKGTTGQFSEKAVDLLKQAESAILEQKKEQSAQAAEILSQNYDVDCGPTGKVTCPVCRGSTVIIKRSYLGDTYKTCPYCNEHGTLDCEEFNKLIRGELRPNQRQ